MDNKITSKSSKRKLLLKTAVEKKGLAKNVNEWNIPAGNLILREGRNYRYIPLKQARELFDEGKVQLQNLIGNYNFSGNFTEEGLNANIEIVKPKSFNKQNIKGKYQNKIIQKVLSKEDKEDFYAIYNFVKDNDIQGKGQIIITSNNQVLSADDVDISGNVSKWFKDIGIYIGMVDSKRAKWNTVNAENNLHYKTKIGNKTIYKYIPKKSESHTKKAQKQAEKQSKKYLTEWDYTIVKFMFVPSVKVSPTKIVQTFRESDSGTCFFDVIEEFLNNKIENVVKNHNYISKLNHLNKFKTAFDGAMPQDKIQMVCDKLNINVELYDILGNKFNEYKCEKQPLTTIKYINNRLNHTEKYVDYLNNIILKYDFDEMKDIIKTKQNNDEPFYYAGSIHKPRMIFSKDGTYKYYDELNDIIHKFNKEIKINDFSIDVLKDNDKFRYLHIGVNYNSHCRFRKLNTLKKDVEVYEPDLKKAYTQYKKSKWYMGFCNNMTPIIKLNNWNVKKCREYLGYYTIKILNIKNQNVKNILYEMGMKENRYYILSSPEIVFLNDKGVDFDILAGSYSFKRWDFDFTDDMLNKIDGKSAYAIFTGKLNSVNYQNNYKFYGNTKHAENLANHYENVYVNSFYNTKWNEKNNKREVIDEELDDKNVECKISFDKKNIEYLGHIGGFITAYCRINVLEELFKIDFDKIYGYKLDGFVIDKIDNIEKFDTGNWALKKPKIDFNWSEKIFDKIDINDELYLGKDYGKLFDKRISLLCGAGGTGKSYNVLKSCNDTFFTSFMWRLTTEKMNEYKIKGLSIHQLLGDGCESYLTTNKIPSVIFIDEITMVHKEHIKCLINMCPYTQFFLGGDVDKQGNYYQCSFKGVSVLKPNDIENVNIIEFTKNYRCKDDSLLERLNALRMFMRNSNFNTNMITKFVEELFNDRYVDFDKSMYDYKNDWILVSVINGVNSQVDYYTNLCNGKKYKCIKHNSNDIYKKINGGEGYLNGEILIDVENPTSKFKRQDAFTIHSFQGITIKEPSKVFIDLNRIFCPRQLYTALSRCEYLHQIYLIRDHITLSNSVICYKCKKQVETKKLECGCEYCGDCMPKKKCSNCYNTEPYLVKLWKDGKKIRA